MQDNLEFLQWTKRHWDQYFPGHDYDALARRKASGAATTSTHAPASSSRTSGGAAARKPANTTAPRVAPRVGSATGGGSTAALRQENEAQREAIAGLEKERDFYFSKLRDIELLIQTAVEENPELEKADNGLVKEIQAILYSTEEGFEIPAEPEGLEGETNGGEELETF
jgi:RP/EB family microtubule-associated protein